jgi:hypothetical protein
MPTNMKREKIPKRSWTPFQPAGGSLAKYVNPYEEMIAPNFPEATNQKMSNCFNNNKKWEITSTYSMTSGTETSWKSFRRNNEGC